MVLFFDQYSKVESKSTDRGQDLVKPWPCVNIGGFWWLLPRMVLDCTCDIQRFPPFMDKGSSRPNALGIGLNRNYLLQTTRIYILQKIHNQRMQAQAKHQDSWFKYTNTMVRDLDLPKSH